MDLTSAEGLRALTDEELDELVHDAKAQEASQINNEGRAAQVAYLTGGGVMRVRVDFTVPCALPFRESGRVLAEGVLAQVVEMLNDEPFSEDGEEYPLVDADGKTIGTLSVIPDKAAQAAANRSVDARLRRACRSAEAYALLDAYPDLSGGTWSEGWCLVAAEALAAVLPGAEIQAIYDDRKPELAQHYVVRWRGWVWDGTGGYAPSTMLARWDHPWLVDPYFGPCQEPGPDTSDAANPVGASEALADFLRPLLADVVQPSAGRYGIL